MDKAKKLLRKVAKGRKPTMAEMERAGLTAIFRVVPKKGIILVLWDHVHELGEHEVYKYVDHEGVSNLSPKGVYGFVPLYPDLPDEDGYEGEIVWSEDGAGKPYSLEADAIRELISFEEVELLAGSLEKG